MCRLSRHCTGVAISVANASLVDETNYTDSTISAGGLFEGNFEIPLVKMAIRSRRFHHNDFVELEVGVVTKDLPFGS